MSEEIDKYHARKKSHTTNDDSPTPETHQQETTPLRHGNNTTQPDPGTIGGEEHTYEADRMDIDDEAGGFFTETFVGAAQTYGVGTTFMDQFDEDQYTSERIHNLYYPFASRSEWEFGSFLLLSNLSIASIDKLLSLSLIKQLNLSFHTAQELRGCSEILPRGPEWKCLPIRTKIPTKTEPELFYRDPLECIQSLLHHPLVTDSIQFTPMRIFETASKTMRIYTEWMSGDAAWSIQEKLPPGSTLLGVVLSSDKTNISAMTGGRMAHPLLLSLANISMDYRMKASNHSLLLLALIPVPKFIYPGSKLRGVLESRLMHECLDIILQPVKKAAEIGIMMSDPLGNLRHTYPILAAYIVDTPESAMLACVAGKTSSVTMANYRQFGDPFRHELRTASTTLAQLQALEDLGVDPWNLKVYSELSLSKFRLNGVHRPFWRDWPLAEPSTFLTPEPLHHWHKMFWDHDAKWCIHAVGKAEIDFRFSILHPLTGFRHFREGISKLKQVTGREHRDIQRYTVGVIEGAVTKGFLNAIRALMDFRYLAQAPEITEKTATKIEAALKEFHNHKKYIIETGARNGKKKRTKDWEIPKLEFLQSVVPNIRSNGVAMQWSADATERAHITEIKIPADMTNKQNYEPQICRHLDREDKCRRFDLATTIRETNVDLRTPYSRSEDHTGTQVVSTATSLLSNVQRVHSINGASRNTTDYFQLALDYQHGLYPRAPLPHRTFVSAQTAIHLVRDPSFKQMSVTQTAEKYHLQDLHGALIDYLDGVTTGERSANSHSPLPTNIKALEVWTKVQVQNKGYFAPHHMLSAQTLNASPPSETWPSGHCDTAIFNVDPTMTWPSSGLKGHRVAQIRLIFRVVSSEKNQPTRGTDGFLTYIQWFDVIPQTNRGLSGPTSRKGPYPDPVSGMFVLKRAKRNGEIMGEVVRLSHIRVLAAIIPRFGSEADSRLSKETVLQYSTEFLLNKYIDKEFFYALSEL